MAEYGRAIGFDMLVDAEVSLSMAIEGTSRDY